MRTPILLVGALAVVLTACGDDRGSTSVGGAARSVDPSTDAIEIVMTDMAFAPTRLDVSPGRTITITFRNDGTVRHEAVFGDLAEQLAHHEDMTAAPGADHDGMDMSDGSTDDAGELTAVALEPGQTIEVTHTFGEDGDTVIGCHEPGHWEAGMRLDIAVV